MSSSTPGVDVGVATTYDGENQSIQLCKLCLCCELKWSHLQFFRSFLACGVVLLLSACMNKQKHKIGLTFGFIVDDELMSAKHKEQLAASRDRLVSNMYPDDVLNRLQARKVLNARDVSRIRDKTQIDGQVELLLDTLMRKPDRAFSELISALVETDQKHVAKLLDAGFSHMISSMFTFLYRF